MPALPPPAVRDGTWAARPRIAWRAGVTLRWLCSRSRPGPASHRHAVGRADMAQLCGGDPALLRRYRRWGTGREADDARGGRRGAPFVVERHAPTKERPSCPKTAGPYTSLAPSRRAAGSTWWPTPPFRRQLRERTRAASWPLPTTPTASPALPRQRARRDRRRAPNATATAENLRQSAAIGPNAASCQ